MQPASSTFNKTILAENNISLASNTPEEIVRPRNIQREIAEERKMNKLKEFINPL